MAFKCPCCQYFTLSETGHYEICPVCYWEDDPLQAQDENFSGGANEMSLKEARFNYTRTGACSKQVVRYVRLPYPNEIKGQRTYG